MSHQTTGDITFAACCNAVGVPPVPNPTPYKSSDGNDFVRISLGEKSIDGKHDTKDLMKAWHRGPGFVRENPGHAFSWLMVWAKTRSGIVGAGKGESVYFCKIGGRGCVLRQWDLATWNDHDHKPRELKRSHGATFGILNNPSLVAGLIFDGVQPVSITSGTQGKVMLGPMATEGPQIDAVRSWPKFREGSEDPLAYFAAADQARNSIIDAIRQRTPDLYLRDGCSHAIINQEALENKDPGTVAVGERIGL